MTTTLRHTLSIALLSLAIPAVASAQNAPSAGFAGVLGGFSLSPSTAPVAAGQVGIRIAPGIFIIGEAGYMRNVNPPESQEQISDVIDELEFELGVPVKLEASLSQLYGFGGVRWNPARAGVSPFVEGGLGVGRVSGRVDRFEVDGQDLTEEFNDLMEQPRSTALLIAFGGGVNVPMSKSASVDLGVRYMRLATTDPAAINAVTVYGAIKFGR